MFVPVQAEVKNIYEQVAFFMKSHSDFYAVSTFSSDTFLQIRIRINPYCILFWKCGSGQKVYYVLLNIKNFFCIFFWRTRLFGHSLCRAFCIFERYVIWIRTQRAAVASRRSTNLATDLDAKRQPKIKNKPAAHIRKALINQNRPSKN